MKIISVSQKIQWTDWDLNPDVRLAKAPVYQISLSAQTGKIGCEKDMKKKRLYTHFMF